MKYPLYEMNQLIPLSVRDAEIERMWDEFANIAFDEDEDGRLVLSEPWLCFPAGTEREEIWHWFDQRHSKGVYWLLYDFD